MKYGLSLTIVSAVDGPRFLPLDILKKTLPSSSFIISCNDIVCRIAFHFEEAIPVNPILPNMI